MPAKRWRAAKSRHIWPTASLPSHARARARDGGVRAATEPGLAVANLDFSLFLFLLLFTQISRQRLERRVGSRRPARKSLPMLNAKGASNSRCMSLARPHDGNEWKGATPRVLDQ